MIRCPMIHNKGINNTAMAHIKFLTDSIDLIIEIRTDDIHTYSQYFQFFILNIAFYFVTASSKAKYQRNVVPGERWNFEIGGERK